MRWDGEQIVMMIVVGVIDPIFPCQPYKTIPSTCWAMFVVYMGVVFLFEPRDGDGSV